MSGESNIVVEARRALLDALAALEPHLGSVILIGAQAIYLHTGFTKSPVAEYTKDADIALDSRSLALDPTVQFLMSQAGFNLNDTGNPGRWLNNLGIPVDIMVAERLAGKGTRSAEIPPHGKRTARRTKGIEGCLIDNSQLIVTALDESDLRSFEIKVAGPASLLIAKIFKIQERVAEKRKLADKDAHDIYRLLVAKQVADILPGIQKMLDHSISRDITRNGLSYLRALFADGPEAEGSLRAGRAELGIGDPAIVAQSVAILASELIDAYRDLNS
ncbi:MAG: hypothetical protein ACYC06_11470 [Ilumatobacteraceae bacterium]